MAYNLYMSASFPDVFQQVQRRYPPVLTGFVPSLTQLILIMNMKLFGIKNVLSFKILAIVIKCVYSYLLKAYETIQILSFC